MNEYTPDEIGTGGHSGLEKTSPVNVNKHLTKKVQEMIKDGRLMPENNREKELYLEAKQEPNEDQFNSDAEADADALASAGFGTDEDYGSASEVL
tara:strand:- start:1264 stop:1548 length:285 start_codon:yes stop_codon:yes gene_type:complete